MWKLELKYLIIQIWMLASWLRQKYPQNGKTKNHSQNTMFLLNIYSYEGLGENENKQTNKK